MAIPVLCDRCRAAGLSGEADFSHLGDLLDFAPVPRRKRVGGWTAQVQRAFIAALAVTGSARRAALAVGRAQFGVNQLLRCPGSEAFRAAHDRAIAIAEARERDLLHAGVAALIPPAPETLECDAERQPAPPITAETHERLAAETMHRAIHGTEVPLFHGGVQVGTRIVHSDALAMQLLRAGPDGAGQSGGVGGGGASGNGDFVVLRGVELRAHRLMLENPLRNRSFALLLTRHPRSIAARHPQPWRFGRTGDLLGVVEEFQQAMRATLAEDPDRAAAFETLFGPEGAKAQDYPDAARHAAMILEIFAPGFVDFLKQGFRVAADRRDAEAAERKDREAELRKDLREEPEEAGQPAPLGDRTDVTEFTSVTAPPVTALPPSPPQNDPEPQP